PEAEKQAHVHMASYLADLGRLRSSAPQGDTLTGDAFHAALDAELEKRGLNRDRLVEIEKGLFAGKPAAYQHFVKHLDSMPTGARLAAYVRSAEALMALQRLYQSQS